MEADYQIALDEFYRLLCGLPQNCAFAEMIRGRGNSKKENIEVARARILEYVKKAKENKT